MVPAHYSPPNHYEFGGKNLDFDHSQLIGFSYFSILLHTPNPMGHAISFLFLSKIVPIFQLQRFGGLPVFHSLNNTFKKKINITLKILIILHKLLDMFCHRFQSHGSKEDLLYWGGVCRWSHLLCDCSQLSRCHCHRSRPESGQDEV